MACTSVGVVGCTGAALGKRYIEVYPVAAAAVVRSWLGVVTPPPAAAVEDWLGGLNPPRRRRWRFLFFLSLAKRRVPLESYRGSVHGGVVGSKSYLTVVETHDAGRQYQHAQAQHGLRRAQAQLMHAQHWSRTQSRSRQGGGAAPLALFAFGSEANAECA